MRERSVGRVLLLELGVGEITPGIITLPFWSMTAKLPDAHLLSVTSRAVRLRCSLEAKESGHHSNKITAILHKRRHVKVPDTIPLLQ